MQSAKRPDPFNVLFLCTGNSARSVMAECILNRLGAGKFRAYSAGSHPAGKVNPIALNLLRKTNYDVSGLRSKSWDEFAAPGAPKLDFVFTVCDDAANEVCPIWPGQPMTAHWGLPDPAKAQGTEAERNLAFADTMRMLTQRIGIFVSLPLDKLSTLSLQKELDAIGRLRRGKPPRNTPPRRRGAPRRVDKVGRPSYVSRAFAPRHFFDAFLGLSWGSPPGNLFALKRLKHPCCPLALSPAKSSVRPTTASSRNTGPSSSRSTRSSPRWQPSPTRRCARAPTTSAPGSAPAPRSTI